MFRQLVAVRFLVHVPVLEKLQLSATATTAGKGSHSMTGGAATTTTITINGRRVASAVKGASTTADATTAPSNSTSERMSVRAAAVKRPPRDTSLSHCMATLSSSSSAMASSRGSMEASKGGSSRHVSKKRRTVDSDIDRGLNVVSRSLKDEEEAEWTDDYDGVGLGLGFDFSINNTTSTAAPHHDDDGHDGDATTNDDDGAFQQQPFTLWMIGWDQLLRLSRHKCCESVSQQQHGPIYGHLIRIMLQVIMMMMM